MYFIVKASRWYEMVYVVDGEYVRR